MDVYYKYVLDALRAQSTQYAQQLVLYRPHVRLQQRGESRPIYQFDKASGQPGGALGGDNFFADLCTDDDPRWRDLDIEYDYIADTWILGHESDPDFLLYMLKYSRGGRVDHLVEDAEAPKLREIYAHYALDSLVAVIDGVSRGRWCVLW